ncbi:MAG: hypothetical protein ACTSRI_16720 [Promethearchaeota archaeon]
MSSRVIYVECNPDELLIQMYGFFKKNIKHSYGKSRIGKLLENNQGHIALIDEDPDGTPIPYFTRTNFSLVKEENGYVIKNDSRGGHTIIEIQPYLEEWVLEACNEAAVNIRDYNLPNDPISLHHIINNNLKKFKRLLNELLNHNCRIKKLKTDILALV